MISVVIPAYNEEEYLPLCLEALAAQTTRETMEVIIVDNNSTDRTQHVAKQFSQTLTIRIFEEEMQRRGAARKNGFSHAQGEIIFSLDADSIPHPQWIERILKKFHSDPDIVAVMTSAYISDCKTSTNILHNIVQPVSLQVCRLYHHHHILPGHSFAVRRDAYHMAGGFDSNFDAQEDIELSNRVAKFGRIVRLHGLPVLMSGRRFREGFLRGWWDYFSTFSSQFWFKKKKVTLREAK